MMKSTGKTGKKKTGKKRVKKKGVASPSLPTPQRWAQRGLVVGAFIVLVVAMTHEPRQASLSEEEIGRSVVAREDVRATFSFESIDLQATAEAEDRAAAAVPEHYRIDQDRVQQRLRLLEERLKQVRDQRQAVGAAVLDALRASTPAQSAAEVAQKAVMDFATQLRADPDWATMPDAAELALWLRPDFDALPERVFGEADEEGAPAPFTGFNPEEPGPFSYSMADNRLAVLARDTLSHVLHAGVRSPVLPTAGGGQRIVIVRDGATGDLPRSSAERTLSELPEPSKATEHLSERLRDAARRMAQSGASDAEWAQLHEAAYAMAEPLVTDTIQFDPVTTTDARQRARSEVPRVFRTIEAGEMIQEGGRRWSPQSIEDARTYARILQEDTQPRQRVLGSLIGHAILVGLILVCLRRSIGLSGGNTRSDTLTQFNLALLLMCATLIVGRIVYYFQPTGLLLPVAAAGILFAILVNSRMAAMVSALIAVMISAQYGYDWRLIIVHGAMALAGIFSIYKVRKRSDMAAASIKATIAGVLCIIAITVAMDSLLSNSALQRLTLIGLNGGLCLLLVPALLSPLERLFGITTDIQLLEYSDLNNELLSRLAIEVPATYAHSLMLGQLAEAAADAIGANGLMARVCAYYHDIGKMRRPEYFIENQTGANIHDELSPRLSARAIAAHVVQGAEMAREYKLPKPIVDGILEHHGTCLIGFFYSLAEKAQKHGDVREEDFRYPGPKPQSPETAILMICDGAESGVRSIKNPNEERVREFVDKIVAARLEDRQFDECNLTMRQLDSIAEVVSRRIVSSLHGRIAYPETAKEEDRDNIIPMQASQPGTPLS